MSDVTPPKEIYTAHIGAGVYDCKNAIKYILASHVEKMIRLAVLKERRDWFITVNMPTKNDMALDELQSIIIEIEQLKKEMEE